MDQDTKKQEAIIAANHAADVQNGLSEADADASDAFERRVIGMDEPDDDNENYSSPAMVRGLCTRCRRTADYCEC